MDAIGNSFVLPTPPVQLSQPAPTVQQAPVLPAPSDPTQSDQSNNDPTPADIQAADQKRLQAVQKAAQDVANLYVVSDKKFTIFKDATGQYITRFTSLRDGTVTYVPAPQLFKLSSASIAPSIVISA